MEDRKFGFGWKLRFINDSLSLSHPLTMTPTLCVLPEICLHLHICKFSRCVYNFCWLVKGLAWTEDFSEVEIESWMSIPFQIGNLSNILPNFWHLLIINVTGSWTETGSKNLAITFIRIVKMLPELSVFTLVCFLVHSQIYKYNVQYRL